jgi:phosphoribosylformylglycinamidine cyclo-ligase
MSDERRGENATSTAYKTAGVDIDAGNEAVERMKAHVAKTFRPEVMSGLGGFGALFRLDLSRFHKPVLVSGADGVGTKLKLAFALDRHDTIGIDAVAMCVNDIVVQGAEPLFFLDYLAVGKLLPEKVEQIVKGVAEGCELAGCALIGGETAEMPGMYGNGEYDIAGFAVGAVNEDEMIDGQTIKPGDAVLGFASSGLHSNGFSLVRKILEDNGYSLDERADGLGGQRIGDLLLTPTRIYVPSVLALKRRFVIKGMAHITGGGFTENIPRILPDECGVRLKRNAWEVPAVFRFLQKNGRLSDAEMMRTFNMGIGMVLVVPPDQAEDFKREAERLGETVFRLGETVDGERKVEWE